MSVYRPEERRLVLRLMAYWDDLRGERDFPAVGDLDPQAIGDDWPWCHVITLADPIEDSVFRYVGESLVADSADTDVDEGLRLGDCPEHTLLYHAIRQIPRMLEKEVPFSTGGEAEIDGVAVLYRSILLPLSNDGTRIDHIFGGANSRRAEGGGG